VIRFRFGLHPVQDVQPWGGDSPTLHWFALTSGWYWIEAGDHELLRYADHTLRRWAIEEGDGGKLNPYVDYYVVRLWEDVLEMVSVLTEPVPPDLVGFVAAELPDWPSWDNTPQGETAGMWHADHSMYMGPLTNAPHIRLWRTITDGIDAVTVDWKHPPESAIGFAAPAAGRVTVPTSSFDAAVSELDHALLAAMEDRVTALESAGPPAGVDLDLRQLRREQRDRATWLPRARARKRVTDWAAVRVGARELLAADGRP
jgi:hypothetical protein